MAINESVYLKFYAKLMKWKEMCGNEKFTRNGFANAFIARMVGG